MPEHSQPSHLTTWSCAHCHSLFQTVMEKGSVYCPHCRKLQNCSPKSNKFITIDKFVLEKKTPSRRKRTRSSENSNSKESPETEWDNNTKRKVDSVVSKTYIILGVAFVVTVFGLISLYFLHEQEGETTSTNIVGIDNNLIVDSTFSISEKEKQLEEKHLKEEQTAIAETKKLVSRFNSSSPQEKKTLFFNESGDLFNFDTWIKKTPNFKIDPNSLSFEKRKNDLWLFNASSSTGSKLFIVSGISNGKWQLDFQVLEAMSEEGEKAFLEEQSTRPKALFTSLVKSDYYNRGFWETIRPDSIDGKIWQCYQITFPSGETVYGYVSENSQTAITLEKTLELGITDFYLTLRFPNLDKKSNQVIIDNVLQKTWLGVTARKLGKFNQ